MGCVIRIIQPRLIDNMNSRGKVANNDSQF